MTIALSFAAGVLMGWALLIYAIMVNSPDEIWEPVNRGKQ